jgi:hypothetical protein
MSPDFVIRRASHPEGHAWVARPASYVVSFWEKLTEPEPPVMPLWSQSGVEILGALDIMEVLSWIEEKAEGRLFTIDLEINLAQTGGGSGRVRIYGEDPPQWNGATSRVVDG